ncbi:MAG: hypothetical protein ACK541_08780 [Burkholderiales bacterium]
MYKLSILFILAFLNGYAIANENVLPNALQHEKSIKTSASYTANYKQNSKNEETSALVIENNNLNYIILYNRDSFEALIEYDVKFDDNSSTNGVVQKISGSYNKLVQTDKLQVSGSQSIRESNNIVINESRSFTYWVDGVIEYPKNEETMNRNKKALKINVKIDKTITIQKK